MSLNDFISTPVILTALACLYLGYVYCARSSKKGNSVLGWRSAESERLRLDAENRYIEVLRRELANAIVSDSPDKMVALYRKAWTFEQEMLNADAARVQAEFDVLTKRYPLYEDFDLLGTRHFVPYSDAVEGYEEDAVAERYLDISKFMILKNINAKSTRPIFSESEDTILRKTMTREIDHRFRAKIIDAMDKYNMVRGADKNRQYESIDYEDRALSIFPLQHFAELRWGILFKDTQEQAIYSVFYDDNSKAYKSYYRSDETFQTEETLHR
jgi:hypothetical protein